MKTHLLTEIGLLSVQLSLKIFLGNKKTIRKINQTRRSIQIRENTIITRIKVVFDKNKSF